MSRRSANEELAYHADCGHSLIWHLSDIHFGKLNNFENDPRELALKLIRGIENFPKAKPDYIFVSGDLTSVADSKEFELFENFITLLANEIWGSRHAKGRILVVPGNHDTHWESNGRNDRMKNFIAFSNASKYCFTPFTNSDKGFGGLFRINRKNPEPGVDVPPAVSLHFKKEKIDLLMIVSSFYSGEANRKLRNSYLKLKKSGITEAELNAIIHSDKVVLKTEYLYMLGQLLNQMKSPMRIALAHHNFAMFGSDLTPSEETLPFNEALIAKEVRFLLNGHIHSSDTEKAYGLRHYSASTLGVSPHADQVGFNMYTFSSFYGCFHGYKWQINLSDSFDKDNIVRLKDLPI